MTPEGRFFGGLLRTDARTKIAWKNSRSDVNDYVFFFQKNYPLNRLTPERRSFDAFLRTNARTTFFLKKSRGKIVVQTSMTIGFYSRKLKIKSPDTRTTVWCCFFTHWRQNDVFFWKHRVENSRSDVNDYWDFIGKNPL